MKRDMEIPFVDLHKQYLSLKKEIDSAISDVIRDTAFIRGSYVQGFEQEFAKNYGVKHCIPVANGTDAIYIALKMLGVGMGDEVITTAHSWISTSETIVQTGAKPVFVDTDDYFTIDAVQIVEKITSNTKAIIPVHLYGQPCDMGRIMSIAQKYNLYVVEDCAQAHYAKWNGKRVGTIGNVGTFSFYPGKNLGAYGDAGAILTNDEQLAEKMRMFANHGALKKHHHEINGINSRMDGIQAAILSAKLPYIREWTQARQQVASWYDQKLAGLNNIKIPNRRDNADHVFHLYVIKTPARDEVRMELKKKDIDTVIHYPTALPFLEAYHDMNHQISDYKKAHQDSLEILSLPIYPELTENQVNYIVEALHNIV